MVIFFHIDVVKEDFSGIAFVKADKSPTLGQDAALIFNSIYAAGKGLILKNTQVPAPMMKGPMPTLAKSNVFYKYLWLARIHVGRTVHPSGSISK